MANPASLPGTDESYWVHTTDSSRFAPLTDDLTVDVAVVGGGIAGLSTAWEVVRTGRSVVVLEADRIAVGVSGYTSAKVTAQHTLIYDRLRRRHGEEAARLYAESQQGAVGRIAAVTAELGLACDLEQRPAVTYSLDPADRTELRAEARAARDAGLDAEYTETTGLPFAVAAAVRVNGQAQFHPRHYLLGVAADLAKRGGRIHERTRVTGLHEGEPCRVTTETGATVTARDVVVATHYPVFDRALLFARMAPRRELVVAAPIDASADPQGMYISRSEGKRSVRTAPLPGGRRLLIVTGEDFTPGAGGVADRYRRLDRWMHERFPAAATSYRWAAQDNDPSDKIALVGPLHPGARHTYVATGFGGWGMTGGVMAGALLSELIAGRSPAWAGLYDPRRLWSTLKEAPTLLKQQAEVGLHFVGDRLRTTHADSVADIPPGSGAVVRAGGRRLAVYRDEDGAAHAVSARCTHLGCLVAFNDAERSWDCPCHGSRFGIDGTVTHGPAVRPLEPHDLDGHAE
ncbi:FAD-dependent oxidoreductase [Streptomyces sp. NBC_01476]|uniref:FAD-dependent oxidoreductase n=1 Tax=Streptomyces sp. NBC_01476 TaxID=2903881 RepID=UPI002E3553B0|nr:FAD-dependent oxidoreductase [Streptomyces sp. NBC_01476]